MKKNVCLWVNLDKKKRLLSCLSHKPYDPSVVGSLH